MAAKGWRATPAITDALLECAFQFDFFQAVKLLGIINARALPVGEGSEPRKEAVRFKSAVNFNFPAADIEDIRPASNPQGPPMEMIINFIGLAGCLGPLPAPYTDLIAQRKRYKDTALADFLDMFNHRLASLMFRVRKNFRIGFDAAAPGDTPFAGYLYALMGMGTPGLRGRMDLRDHTLLPFASFFAQQCRNARGLEQLLQAHFQAPVSCRQFRGRWFDIDQSAVTRIGARSGQCRRLGIETVLGTRAWDQQSGFEVLVGPLTAEQFACLLPDGRCYPLLLQLVRLYAGDHLDVDILLLPAPSALPQVALGAQPGPRLGWTSYLKAQSPSAARTPVRICPRLRSGEGAQ